MMQLNVYTRFYFLIINPKMISWIPSPKRKEIPTQWQQTPTIRFIAQPEPPKARGYDPSKWGPSAWTLIHLAALAYPDNPTEDDKKNMYTFITSLKHILPCPGCKKGFYHLLNDTAFGYEILNSSDSLFSWTVLVHSMVNEREGKTASKDAIFWKKYYNQTYS